MNNTIIPIKILSYIYRGDWELLGAKFRSDWNFLICKIGRGKDTEARSLEMTEVSRGGGRRTLSTVTWYGDRVLCASRNDNQQVTFYTVFYTPWRCNVTFVAIQRPDKWWWWHQFTRAAPRQVENRTCSTCQLGDTPQGDLSRLYVAMTCDPVNNKVQLSLSSQRDASANIALLCTNSATSIM